LVSNLIIAYALNDTSVAVTEPGGSRSTCPGCKTLCPAVPPAVELQWRWP